MISPEHLITLNLKICFVPVSSDLRVMTQRQSTILMQIAAVGIKVLKYKLFVVVVAASTINCVGKATKV